MENSILSKRIVDSVPVKFTQEEYIRRVVISNGFTETLARQAIHHLGLFSEYNILGKDGKRDVSGDVETLSDAL